MTDTAQNVLVLGAGAIVGYAVTHHLFNRIRRLERFVEALSWRLMHSVNLIESEDDDE
jgi:hypothetical protein